MFSITTMASSTTNPEAIVSAISVRLLIEKPSAHIAANAPTRLSGTEIAAMIVARGLPRNRKITNTTRPMANTSSNCTSATDARMPSVRSVSTVTRTSAGNCACRSGSAALIASTVAMTFAPGWRCTSMITAGCLFIQLPVRVFSTPSVTLATSDRRTGWPLFVATISAA